MVDTSVYGEGVEVTKEVPEEFREILSPEAVAFVAKLAREFTPTVEERLRARQERQERINAGEMPDFLPETREIREGDWKIAPIPDDLRERRGGVSGPPPPTMTIKPPKTRGGRWVGGLEGAKTPPPQTKLGRQPNKKEGIQTT